MEERRRILVSKEGYHIEIACSKALGVFLYKSLVVPTLISLSVCWFKKVTKTNFLGKVQKRGTKWISSDWKSNYKQWLLECFLLAICNSSFDANFDQYLFFRDHPCPLGSDSCLTF